MLWIRLRNLCPPGEAVLLILRNFQSHKSSKEAVKNGQSQCEETNLVLHFFHEALEATFHPDERFCSAFLQKPEGLRQCKNKPLRNSDRCRHHSKLEIIQT
ncbi:hypothetical protein PoB_004175600 [Plakobranchus ocellatus]|uniref:Uncharacterized protein n=1 Tax=Plakobranchus ocellatus TaxID=259542 RepID=A0AAV4AVX7_9GAST|nr:hypothetical protein PoB_004175600 [Plakobranchus ocellatus]